MEKKEGHYFGDDGDRLFTRDEVTIIVRRRNERELDKLFQRYGVKNQEELDDIVKEYKEEQFYRPIPTAPCKKPVTLEELIGLDKVKRKVGRLANLCLKNDHKNIKMSMNYVFMGNPGTGKTVTARALAKIFYDKGIISRDEVVEVGRSNLIAPYTGQTAIKVNSVLEKAIGAVLLIDEAYSLDTDRFDKSDFCHEALATINKFIEDHRGQLVVIFTGYKDETLEMLKRNKGLKSRINAYIDFPDYDTEALTQITRLQLSKYYYEADDLVVNKIVRIVESNKNKKEYGNARDIRNVIEGIAEFQADRSILEPWDRDILMEDVINWQIDNNIVLDEDITEA